jgi:tetratricopeptide (TPR) repeat protein
VLIAGVACSALAQVPAAPQPQDSAGQPPTTAAQQTTSPDDQNPDNTTAQKPEKKPPSRLKRALDRAKPECVHVGTAETCWDNKKPGSDQSQASRDSQARVPRNQAPPRSEAPPGESSSRETQTVDISPPPDDMTHEGADTSDVNEFHAYDPHRAAKDVEVGDFYFHKKDYRAAESRYQGALQWKPNDAIATFRLAQSEEKLGKKEEALNYYQQYLKILPDGDQAAEARKAIERLTK